MEASKGSIDVPSVNELAKEATSLVPERYVCEDLHLQPSSSQQQLPIIDFSKFFSPDFNASELHNLDYACKHWGFFQLINHGVSTSLVENVKKGIEQFFNLPIEEKKRFWQKEGEREGFGQLFVVSKEQKLEWADNFFCTTFPKEARKPHLFPKLPLPFRDYLDAYSEQVRKIGFKIIEFMAQALNMEGNEIRELINDEEGRQTMRINYYPPCPQPDKVIGINAHSDNTTLTILLQVNEMEGLQIKKDGLWLPVSPLPNAFIINLGNVWEIVSNGIYKSIEHRATVNSKKERMSMATFLNPKMDAMIGPSPSLVTPDRPPLFMRISMFEYYEGFFKRELRGKSHLDFIRIHNESDET